VSTVTACEMWSISSQAFRLLREAYYEKQYHERLKFLKISPLFMASKIEVKKQLAYHMEKIALKQNEDLHLDMENPALCLVRAGSLVVKNGNLKVSRHEHFGTLDCMVKTKGQNWRVASTEGAEI